MTATISDMHDMINPHAILDAIAEGVRRRETADTEPPPPNSRPVDEQFAMAVDVEE